MIRVLQIIDSLHAGGAERVAVNYANGLVDFVDASHICVTRDEGPLFDSIDSKVGYIFLNKTSTLDIGAILRLKKYIKKYKINIIHAHSTSFFIAVLVKLVLPKVKIVWHDHYGNSEFLNQRPKKALRFSSRLFSYIFSVNHALKDWSTTNLNCKKVKYIKNFPVLLESNSEKTELKGYDNKRILCLANLRVQKNHLRLLEAFELVKNKYPEWTLHCVGKDFKDSYSKLFFTKLKTLGLHEHVYFYHSKSDILNIMRQCTIGMLVSKSEGLPLALLEYGLSKLPVIATNVGQCGVLIPNKTFGVLLDNDKPETIAKGIISYIEDTEYRTTCAQNFNTKIIEEYSSKVILSEVVEDYKSILSKTKLN